MNWHGESGKAYTYHGYPIATKMKAVPANYIFAKSVTPGNWTPIYIGECESLEDRFANHHKKDCIFQNGATHVFTHLSSTNHQERLDEETDLRARFNTKCNDQ